MILLSLILTNIIWVGYSLTEGIREGFYWNYENKSKKVCDFNVNPVFNLQRLLITLVTGGFLVHILGHYSLFCLFSMVIMFPFFHNGTYYYTRNKLDDRFYPKRWSDESVTIPRYAPLMSYKKRTILMCVGILFQVFTYVFLIMK